MDELEKEQPEEFINFVRMNSVEFDYLSTLVTPILSSKDTNLTSMSKLNFKIINLHISTKKINCQSI